MSRAKLPIGLTGSLQGLGNQNECKGRVCVCAYVGVGVRVRARACSQPHPGGPSTTVELIRWPVVSSACLPTSSEGGDRETQLRQSQPDSGPTHFWGNDRQWWL